MALTNRPSPLSTTARTATTSAIRDLLDQARLPGMVSLAGGLPDPDRFPVAEVALITDRLLHEQGRDLLQYGRTAGSLALRTHVVATTAAAADVANVIVTTGSQQALHLVAMAVLDAGDQVVVGDPDYLGALQAFRARGAALVAVPTGPAGMDLHELRARLSQGLSPRLVYIVPHHHNPTGASLPEQDHSTLLALAAAHDFLVLFDDPYRELFLEGTAPRDPEPHPNAIYLRSASKVLAPGLRVGWLIGPEWLCAAVERLKQAVDLHTSALDQAIVTEAMTAAWFPSHLEALRSDHREKRDALCAALSSTLGNRIHFSKPAGGMFVWADLQTDTDVLLPHALAEGVAYVPGSAFAVTRDLTSHLRLSWATSSIEELHLGVRRLARALETSVRAPTTSEAGHGSTP